MAPPPSSVIARFVLNDVPLMLNVAALPKVMPPLCCQIVVGGDLQRALADGRTAAVGIERVAERQVRPVRSLSRCRCR